MDKMKLIISLLILALGVGGFAAWTFYTEKQSLKSERDSLSAELKQKKEDYSNLNDSYSSLNTEKQELERRLSSISDQLSVVERERDGLASKYKEASLQNDLLAEKVEELMAKPKISVESMTPSGQASIASEEYWADFVKAKAQLESELEGLKEKLAEQTDGSVELEKKNKEIAIKIDEITKERDRLEEEIRFKERTIGIMSKDLVNEREARQNALEELKVLRSENLKMKRESVLVNKEKSTLQNDFNEVLKKKQVLESKISEIENVVREKTLAFDSLQDHLQRAIKTGKQVTSAETASVELPPIVVKPDTSGIEGLRGEVIAVNPQEKFVIVDIGESQGVRPGIILRVLRGSKDIGSVEVIETRREISAADIKELSTGLLIQEGDVVVSK
ncbi:MAG: hypothetical protein ABH872_05140 [Candidatus Omnitrophota bacterium]